MGYLGIWRCSWQSHIGIVCTIVAWLKISSLFSYSNYENLNNWKNALPTETFSRHIWATSQVRVTSDLDRMFCIFLNFRDFDYVFLLIKTAIVLLDDLIFDSRNRLTILPPIGLQSYKISANKEKDDYSQLFGTFVTLQTFGRFCRINRWYFLLL